MQTVDVVAVALAQDPDFLSLCLDDRLEDGRILSDLVDIELGLRDRLLVLQKNPILRRTKLTGVNAHTLVIVEDLIHDVVSRLVATVNHAHVNECLLEAGLALNRDEVDAHHLADAQDTGDASSDARLIILGEHAGNVEAVGSRHVVVIDCVRLE